MQFDIETLRRDRTNHLHGESAGAGDEVPVGEHHALGRAGGAARVHDHRQVGRLWSLFERRVRTKVKDGSAVRQDTDLQPGLRPGQNKIKGVRQLTNSSTGCSRPVFCAGSQRRRKDRRSGSVMATCKRASLPPLQRTHLDLVERVEADAQLLRLGEQLGRQKRLHRDQKAHAGRLRRLPQRAPNALQRVHHDALALAWRRWARCRGRSVVRLAVKQLGKNS